MTLDGYKVLNDRFEFQNLRLEYNEKIESFLPSESTEFKGYIIPGLVDVHTHGVIGQDANHMSDIESYIEYMYSKGITTFYPTTVSASLESLAEAVSVFKDDVRISGLNIEGPFLNKDFKGAHDENVLCEAYLELLYTLQEKSGNKVKLMTVAPEIGRNMEFIAKATEAGVHISLGHSACDYETAVTAMEAGADHITHLFNAMKPLHHRNSGLVGAAFDKNFYVEIITDGIHVCPEVVRLAYHAIGSDRLLIISDCMAATGLADGNYKLGDLDVVVKDSVAHTLDGAIAGSTHTIYDMVRSVANMGIPMEEAIKMATKTPADSVGETEIGVLSAGKKADFVILDKDFSVLQTIRGGETVYSAY